MPAIERMVRNLCATTALDAADIEELYRLPLTMRSVPARAAIVSEGQRPGQCCLLIEGFACRSKTTELGKRQILSIHIPGDVPDLQSLHLHVMDHDLVTLCPSRLGYIPHDAVRDLTRKHPNLAEALWRETLRDAAVFREWIVNIGRRAAVIRLAHLFAEIAERLEAVGLSDGTRFELPMTQLDMADALGLTPVHVNRVVQELRQADLLQMRRYSVFLPDVPRLKKFADFDDLYLHRRALSE